MLQRSALIDRIKAGNVPEILIIGGGINGAGVFRDLAAQGVPALLVDAGDFASGTSAAPSRLIHGGLRYLETGEASLVRESLVERNMLLKNAHHVVHPQPVWVPLKKYFAGSLGAAMRFLHLTTKPGPKGAIPLKIGLTLYDMFARVNQTMPNHRMLAGKSARQAMPVLAADVIAVGEYYDAYISHPERLVLELLADAEDDCGASMAVPYLAADAASGGSVTLVDRLEQASYSVRPKLVINAAGPWVDRVQSGLGFSGRLMGGTRGTHLVLRKPSLASALDGRMLYFETPDHRACLALPFDDERVYVGTTDIRVDDPDERYFTEAEIDYIFDVLKPVLPNEDLSRDDIIFTMGGVRPLPYQNTEVTGQISRDHRIDELPSEGERSFDTMVLVGGKWTTYRAFGEQVTDRVLEKRGLSRRVDTKTLVIGGARDFPGEKAGRSAWASAVADETGLSKDRCLQLSGRYGSGARVVAKAEAGDPAQIGHLAGYSAAEIRHICREERVSRLQDIVLRRTLMAFEGAVDKDGLAELADVAADALGWSDARKASEIADVTDLLRDKHRVELA